MRPYNRPTHIKAQISTIGGCGVTLLPTRQISVKWKATRQRKGYKELLNG